MATITHLNAFYDHSANYSRRIGVYTGPASYTTGGDPFPPEQLSLGKLDHVDFAAGYVNNTTAPYLIVYDRTNKKAVWFVPNTGAEVSAATNLSTFSADFEAVGL